MYLLYCLALLAFVYVLPALAVYPNLCKSARTVYAIPVVSAGIVYACVSGLQALQLYSANTVLLLSVTFFLIAQLRLRRLAKTESFDFDKWDGFIALFLICLMLPYFFKLGTEAFERGDEIYSWNFWALQHVFSEPLDFSHTSATYPQLFPKLLSYGYLLLGDIQLQCPQKAMLGMFPLAMLGAWASVMRPFNPNRVFLFLLVTAYVVGGLKLEQFFNDGYADPIMTSALISSMAFALHTFYHANQSVQQSSAGLMVLCAVVACATKQPAFMWCALLAPALLLAKAIIDKRASYALLAAAALGFALVWFLTEGQSFYQNRGVLILSFEGRGYVEQFGHVFHRYLIQNPFLLALFVLTAWLAKTMLTRTLFYGFILPQTILWLLFGAYQLRLGQHVISASTLLTLYSLKDVTLPKTQAISQWLDAHKRGVGRGFVGLSAVACVAILVKAHWGHPGIDFTQGGRVSLNRYFEQDAQKVFDTIYSDKQALLWVPTRYLYGIFYSHTQLTTPDYLSYNPYDQSALSAELLAKQPDYVFTVSPEVIDGPGSGLLQAVITQCPVSFQVFAEPPNKFQYTTFKVDKQALQSDPCLKQLASTAQTNSSPST